MAENGVQLTPRMAVSLGLIITLVGALVATAVTWGKMEAQVATKMDCSAAERDFVRKTDLTERLDSIDRRLTSIEAKIDRLASGDQPR